MGEDWGSNEGAGSMQTLNEVNALKRAVEALRTRGDVNTAIALVPTMGALHEGHMTLVEHAKRIADHVIVSIFVNPAQFGPKEDLSAYPRPFAEDQAMLAEADVELLWHPDVTEMYPDGHATRVSVDGLTSAMDGKARPGHFDGVATVVTKLFNQVRPDIALFGEKDYQQLCIIRRMVRDLDMGIDIIGVPTVREEDGLALSSRNGYLTKTERKQASVLPAAMREASDAIAAGAKPADAIKAAKAAIKTGGFASIDYLDLRDGDLLQPLTKAKSGARLLIAARIGKTRLIDNWPISLEN